MKNFFFIVFLVFSFSLGKAQGNDTINFDNSNSINPILNLDSITGSWQIGAPNKSVINYPVSNMNTLITDTLNPFPYPVNSYAYFSVDLDSAYHYAIGVQVARLYFSHWLDINSGDGIGYIEVWSNNQWEVVYNYHFVNNANILLSYDESYYLPNDFYDWPVSYWFIESTTNWVQSCLNISCVSLINPSEINRSNNKIQFRFAFYSSDNLFNSDGWAIDDIVFQNFVGECIGNISENVFELQLSVYPTLTDNKITFETESQKFSQISIYDYNGKQVGNFNFNKTNYQTIQLSQLSPGMYFYSVDNGNANGKFIIEK